MRISYYNKTSIFLIYYHYFTINKLLKTEPKNNILYINFEDDRLINIKISDLDDVIPIFFEMANPDGEKNIYLFFDEIQNIENWEKYIRRIYDTKKFRIYLSGSSSKLLSREISTSLRGRNLEYVIMPLNFKEYLEFNGKEYSSLTGFTDQKGYIISELRNYLEYGGYPEVVIEKNNDTQPGYILDRNVWNKYCIGVNARKRDINMPLQSEKIITIIGPRRYGKGW